MRRIASVLPVGLFPGPLAAAEKTFRPGGLWPDNNGVHINCHGGGILVHGETFYWFGQHMIEGEAGNSAQGVHVYSSADSTFHGQSTYVLPLPGKPGAFIFMADRWQPKNAIDGRHLWQPIQFKDGTLFVEWRSAWDSSFFEKTTIRR